MTHLALKIMAEEHRALATILGLLDKTASKTASPTPEDFEVLRAMLVYIAEFPEVMHHKKETNSFFPVVLARSHGLESVIKELNDQHDRGERAVGGLMQKLLSWEMIGPARHQEFLDAVRKYKDFYLKHMAVEVEMIIPVAEQVLTEDDWEILDSVFAENKDPLAGHRPTRDFERLFAKITARHGALLTAN